MWVPELPPHTWELTTSWKGFPVLLLGDLDLSPRRSLSDPVTDPMVTSSKPQVLL